MHDAPDSGLANFVRAVRDSGRLTVLTGAGVSTGSGIPDYRDRNGEWKRKQPVHLPEFLASEVNRKRYWARSMVGWRAFGRATPNAAHRHLAALEAHGVINTLITQNVDGLHQRAGSHDVIDLHGRLDAVRCLDCDARFDRAHIQDRLEAANEGWHFENAQPAPDGDVDLEGADYTTFDLAPCEVCGGTLKPDVVFFGENVPRPRVERAMARLAEADALLVVGSSLMVYSGYRFVRAAVADGKAVWIVNQGRTRGDDDATARIDRPAGDVLESLLAECNVGTGVSVETDGVRAG